MANDVNNEVHPTIDERRKALVAQGRMYRAAINRSKETVQANLHVDVLAKNAANQLWAKAYSAFDNLFNLDALKRGNLKTLVPLVTTGVSGALSILSKRGVTVSSVLSRLSNRGLNNVRSGYVTLSRKGLVKPVIGGAAVLVAIGAAGYFLNKNGHLTGVRRQLDALRDSLSRKVLSR
jgi:hypothetical protein